MKEKIKMYIGGTAIFAVIGYFGICIYSILTWCHRLCGVDDGIAKLTNDDDI